MGQVPAVKDKKGTPASTAIRGGDRRILVIGNGRLASTLVGVLHELSTSTFDHKIHFSQWSRGSAVSLIETLKDFDATHIWLAIADDAIAGFAHEHQSLLKARTVVHFAGSLPSFEFVHAAHPLTSFSRSLTPMTLRDFSRVPFILDREAPELSDLLPAFTNVSYRIDPAKRPYYHALCAMSGNFTVLLWETVALKFERELGLPRTALDNYRGRIFENLANAVKDETVLTGPIARGDHATIRKHRSSLLEKYEMPLLKIYDGFLDLYRTAQAANKHGSSRKQKEQS